VRVLPHNPLLAGDNELGLVALAEPPGVGRLPGITGSA
jgi:hypothetical protein